MKRNFKIVDSIALVFGDFYLDIHNDYDVVNISISIRQNSLIEISFERLNERWVNKNNPNKLKLIFDQIKYLDYSENLLVNFSSTIEDIGFKDKDDIDYDWIMSEDQSNIESNIFFRFEDGSYIKIYSHSATLTIE